MAHPHLLSKIIDPLPPVHQEELPHIGAGLRFAQAPTRYLAELRERYGDTYLVDIFGFNLLMTYSPRGLESLYQYSEEEASFAMATFDMIGFKTPIETLIDTDSKLFYHLLMNKKMPAYVETIDRVVRKEFERWQTFERVDIFDAIRTLEQRVGYALWLAEEAAEDRYWPELKRCFDDLSQEVSFVDPKATLETITSDKAKERAAVQRLYQLVPQIEQAHDANPDRVYAGIDFFRERFAEEPLDEDALGRKVIHNIMNANQGFLSNLYAAIAWVIVRLLEHPAVCDKVKAEIAAVEANFTGDICTNVDALNALEYLEQVMMESVRMAQRSITLRKVMKPIEFDDGQRTYKVEPGIYITTMLSVTNNQSPELRTFNPDNYNKNQLAVDISAYGKESVSTFGHGRHACPAQRFSHHMVKIVVIQLLRRFNPRAEFSEPPQPSTQQMGGVSRPETPILVSLRQA